MRLKLINGPLSMGALPNAWASACVLDSKNGCECLKGSKMDGALVMEALMIRSILSLV